MILKASTRKLKRVEGLLKALVERLTKLVLGLSELIQVLVVRRDDGVRLGRLGTGIIGRYECCSARI